MSDPRSPHPLSPRLGQTAISAGRGTTLALLTLFGLLTGLALGSSGCGAGATGTALTTLRQPQGKVEARSRATEAFAPATDGMSLPAGGVVRTGDDGIALLHYPDGTEVSLHSDTYYEIKDQTLLGRQDTGSARYRVAPQKQTIGVETPHGVTAVLGTFFRLDVTASQTVLTLQEGKVRFTSSGGPAGVELTPGQQLSVTGGQPLGTPAELDPITLETLFNPGAKVPDINRR